MLAVSRHAEGKRMSKAPPVIPSQGFKPQQGLITLKLEFMPLAFMLFACTPIVTINGKQQSLAWGTYAFEFPPGKYKVTVFFRYMLADQCGRNDVEFELREGETKTVSYFMWPVMFLPGSISVS